MSHFDSASGLADRVVGAPSMVLLVTSVSDGGGSRPLSQVVVGELRNTFLNLVNSLHFSQLVPSWQHGATGSP